MSISPFHLAMPTRDLAATIAFYTEYLGAGIGRQDETCVDFDLFGHQVVFHYCGGETVPKYYNPVDSQQVPVPHFGVVLSIPEFEMLADRLKAKGMKFVIDPYLRFKDTPGEQWTMFFLDPNDYALEFKAFKDKKFLFEPFES